MIKAVIFDMDGVISKTSRFHTKAKKRQLLKYGISLHEEEIEERFAGVSSEIMFKKLFREHEVDEDHRKAAQEKRKIYRKLTNDNIEPVDGVLDLISELEDKYTLGLASSSPIENIERILKALNLEKTFEATVSAKENGMKSKPDPQIYLEAAKRLSVDPKNCVAIEDGIKGMKSARNAGMTVVAYVENKNRDYPADIKVSEMDILSTGRLEKIS